MRYCRKIVISITVIFSAFQVISATSPSAGAKPDTISHPSVTAVNQTAPNADTSLLIEDLTVKHGVPPQSAVSKSSLKSRADSLGLLGQLVTRVHSADTLQPNAREMFRKLGNFHKAMGIYNVSAGILAAIAGAAILDKADILPFSLSLITLGGITVGIGVWEITIGSTLGR
jgi:hypothetical protein